VNVRISVDLRADPIIAQVTGVDRAPIGRAREVPTPKVASGGRSGRYPGRQLRKEQGTEDHTTAVRTVDGCIRTIRHIGADGAGIFFWGANERMAAPSLFGGGGWWWV
jgi:hypothetical protein